MQRIFAVAGRASLSAALWYAALGLHPHWWAAWLAPLPVLVAAGSTSGRAAFLLGAAAFLAGWLSLAPYYWNVAGPVPTLLVGMLQSLGAGAAVLLASRAARRLPPWMAVLAYPAVLAALDYVAEAGSPHGTAGSLAYTQMDFLPALQVASLGGAPAVVFLLALVPASVALLLVRGQSAILAGGAGLGLAALLLGWGAWRSAAPVPAGIQVALLATDRFAGIPKGWDRVYAAYAPAIQSAISQGAKILLLPEKSVVLPPLAMAAAVAALTTQARTAGVTIVLGALAVDGQDRLYNRAVVALPDGTMRSYDKQHMVPGWEDSQIPGHATLMLPPAVGPVGVAICKDMDFPALGRAYAQAGARVMLAPAWDFSGAWGNDAWLHGRMGMLRSVESGFSLVRAARTGALTVTDRTGRVLAEAPSQDGMGVLLASAPLGAPTLYAKLGDVFGMACVAATLLLMWRVRKEVVLF